MGRMDFLVIVLCLSICSRATCLIWDHVRCALDAEESTPDGRVSDMGRFPWLGVVQHSVYIGGATKFAITTGVLIHPGYAIASAEDMAKIPVETLANSTKFIVWQQNAVKYSMDVLYYYLHPEYEEKITFVSLALLELAATGETSGNDFVAPVLPICLPVKGSGAFTDLLAVKMADENGELHKEMFEVNFVEDNDCEEFYFRAKLNYKKMSPMNSICAVSARQLQSCVWEGGVALISRQSWGFWRLIGLGVRGPGCAAPSRFLNIHDYMMWIDELLQYPDSTNDDTHKFILRSVSPVKFVMYKTDGKLSLDSGSCEREIRGTVIYKDNSEIVLNNNFAQGFFFVSIAQVASVTCAIINLEVTAGSNLALWVEHQCHKDLSGDHRGFLKRRELLKDARPLECFLYFKSVAYLEFRFFFSYRANLDVTVFGLLQESKSIPIPWKRFEPTPAWWPTDRWIRWGNFFPYYAWMYDL